MFIDEEKKREIKRKCGKSSIKKEESEIIKFHPSVKWQGVFRIQIVAIDDDGEIKGAEEIQFSMSSSCEAM
jgi:hypothetical protein